jgi:hypothetical protein
MVMVKSDSTLMIPNSCPLTSCSHLAADLIGELPSDINAIIQRNNSSPAGDFNELNINFLEEYCGLSLTVHDITHGKKVLDSFY